MFQEFQNNRNQKYHSESILNRISQSILKFQDSFKGKSIKTQFNSKNQSDNHQIQLQNRVKVIHKPSLRISQNVRQSNSLLNEVDPNTLILNIFCYDATTAGYLSSFPVNISKNNQIKDLEILILAKFGLINTINGYDCYIGKLRTQKQARIYTLGLLNGSTIIYKPKRARLPRMNHIQGNRYTRKEILVKNPSISKMVPLFDRSKLQTIPSFVQLSRMNAKELSHVEKFSVFNKFGRVDFLEPVDIRYEQL